jgi:predicted RNA methylase
MSIFTDNADFYPTPKEVIEQMMMGENIVGKTVLEPSAGKGDIVDWLKANGAGRVIACEKDPNIRKLLNGKCEILADDFLTVKSEDISHVDYIVMNPPFSEGTKHILHAFDIAPAGCTVISLCNSQSVSSGWRDDKTKQRLIETIELYGLEEYLGNVFDKAERKTDVSVALVKLYKGGTGENEFADYFFSATDEDLANMNQEEGIMPYNLVRELVNRYVSAVKLFDDTLAAAQKINEIAQYPDAGEYDYLPVRFGTITGGYDGKEKVITHQQYKKELQKYYWHIIFKKLNMEKYATKHIREQINKFIEQQTNVPFTMGNIYRVIDMVIQTNGQRMQKALVEAFDLICSFSAENTTAGEKWKTNANYMVNRKFIVPYMCKGYHDRYVCHGSRYCTKNGKEAYPTVQLEGYNVEQLEDVCKALCYITGTNYDHVAGLYRHHDREEWGEWFVWGFFKCKAYKKGTMHFEFLDEDVWFKFNYEVAKLKGWALPKKSDCKQAA